MTLFDVDELCAYWTEHPPVHLLVAGLIGVKPKSLPSPQLSMRDFSQLPAVPGMLGADVHAGISEPVVLDFAALKARAGR